MSVAVRLMTVCYQEQFHPAPGSRRSSKLHKMYQSRCTAKNSWWWAKRLPETCRVVIPTKLEFSASVSFIHKESVTMHGRSYDQSNNRQLTAAQCTRSAEGPRFDKQKIPSCIMNCFVERRANRYLNCYCGSFEMWCWGWGGGAAKISWTDRVRYEELLQRVEGRGTSYRQ
jgi:hypothetical protein